MKRFFVPLVCVLVLLLLHSMVRYHITSPFFAPASIAILFATAIPLPALAIGITVILLELFSSLPQGSMILLFLIPLFTKYITSWATPDASLKFFGYIFSTVLLQILTLVTIGCIRNICTPFAIPFSLAILQVVATTVSTFVFALICHDTATRQ